MVNVVNIEKRKFTSMPAGCQMVFTKEYVESAGFNPTGKYVILYEDGKITIAKALKSAEVKEVEQTNL